MKRRALFVCISLIFSMNAMASGESSAKLYYFENIPNHDQKIGFTFDQFCDAKQAPVGIQDFYSEKKYPANTGDSGKQKAVRIVHLYVAHNRNCNKVSGDKFEETFQIPRSKLMTHVYVTVDSDIEVRSIQ